MCVCVCVCVCACVAKDSTVLFIASLKDIKFHGNVSLNYTHLLFLFDIEKYISVRFRTFNLYLFEISCDTAV